MDECLETYKSIAMKLAEEDYACLKYFYYVIFKINVVLSYKINEKTYAY